MLPAGFRCDAALLERYEEVSKDMMPLIRRKASMAQRAVAGMDFDDLVQEGRLAILSALASYDEKKGPWRKYVGVVLKNTFNGLIGHSRAHCRMPRMLVDGEAGEKRLAPVAPASLDDVAEPSAEEENAEEQAQLLEKKKQVFEAHRRIRKRLKPNYCAVYDCMVTPSAEFMKFVRDMGGNPDKPMLEEIAAYVGISKQSVDYGIHRIRMLFVELTKGEFSDLFGELIKKDRPHISAKKGYLDWDFVEHIAAKRGLELKPNPDSHTRWDFYQKSENGERLIVRYPWGTVMTARWMNQSVTYLMECRFFDANYALVYGKNNVKDQLELPWYNALIRELKEAHKESNMAKKKEQVKELPPCVGTYETDDTQCNGDPEMDEKPCAWQIRCAALKEICERTGRPLDDFVTMENKKGPPVDGEPNVFGMAKDHRKLLEECDEMIDELKLEVDEELGHVVSKAGEDEDEDLEDEDEDEDLEDEDEDEDLEDEDEDLEDEDEDLEDEDEDLEDEDEDDEEPAEDEQDDEDEGDEGVETASGDEKAEKGKGKKTGRKKKRGRKPLPPGSRLKTYPEELRELWEHFRLQLEENAERRFMEDEDLLEAGMFYVRDRTEHSGYASVYCKTDKGRDIALAAVRFKTRTKQLDIETTLSVKKSEKAATKPMMAKLKLVPFNDGQFKAIATEMNKERVGIMAELICRAIDKEFIKLPEAP